MYRHHASYSSLVQELGFRPTSLELLSIKPITLKWQYINCEVYQLKKNGIPIFTFGESIIDKCLYRHEAQWLLSQLPAQVIFCVDSKRTHSECKLEDITKSQTLLNLYHDLGLLTCSNFRDIDFHLADIFEIRHGNLSPVIKNRLIGLLHQYYTLGAALPHLPMTEDLMLFLDNITHKHIGIGKYSLVKNFMNSLVFVPNNTHRHSFLTALSQQLNEDKFIYIHCASGAGRTGYFVLLYIMLVTNCRFADAFEFMKRNYNCCIEEIERSYLPENQLCMILDLIN